MTTTYDHSEVADKWIRTIRNIDDKRQLTLTTRKASNGQLSTFATVATIDGDFVVYKLYVDFLKSLETVKARATAKNLKEQHARWRVSLDEIEKEAIAFYYPAKEAAQV